MATRLTSRLYLLLLAFGVMIAIAAVAMGFAVRADAQAAPTIQSDKADYSPGSLVTLTGSGWQAGESVNIRVNDDQGQTWSRNVDVTADANGNISDSFTLPDWFVATYSVTATGAQSGVTTTTFTDGNVSFNSTASAPSSFKVTYTKYQGTGSASNNVCSDSIGTKTSNLTWNTGDPNVGNPNNGSIRIDSVTTTVSGYTFDHWTIGSATGSTLSNNCISGVINIDLFAHFTFTPTNTAPVLGAIGNKSVAEETALSFTASASDPGDTVSYSLANGTTNCDSVTSCTDRSGASINSSTGAFTWTPTEAQGPGTYRFKVVATDSGNLSDDEEITVTVNEVNVAPVLAAIGPKSVDENALLSFTATATDADRPNNTLTYSLADGSNCTGTQECTKPSGATITPSGAFSWTPGFSDAGVYKLTVRVTDNGSPVLSDEEEITITVNNVNRPPTTPGTITSTELVNNDGTFTLNWGASTDPDGDNVTYTLEQKDNTSATTWDPVASGLTSASYTFGAGNPEPEGTWDFRVKAVDNYTTPASSGFSTKDNLVNVDKTKPNAPTLSFGTTGQSLKATVNGVDWYKDSALINVTDNDDPNNVRDNSTGSGVDPTSFLASFSVTQNGTSSVSRTVKDKATNESAASTPLSVHVDANAPTSSLDTATNANGTYTEDTWTNKEVTVKLKATDGESGVEKIVYKTDPNSNTYSTYSASSGILVDQEGTTTIYYHAVDNVGHVESPDHTFKVKLDKTNPTIDFTVLNSPDPNTGWYNISTGGPQIDFECEDLLSGIASCGPDDTIESVQPNTNATLEGTAVDNASNSASTTAGPYKVDLGRPDAPSAIDLVAASDTGADHTDDITSDTTPEFNVSAEKGSTVELFYEGTNGLLVSIGSGLADSSTGVANIIVPDGKALTDGTYTIVAKATDVAGNVSVVSNDASLQLKVATIVTVDTTAPTLNLPANPANITKEATGPNGAAVTFTATADDTNPANPSVSCTKGSPAVAVNSGDVFPLGTTTVNCSATDAAGNAASGSFTVTVQDTTAPAQASISIDNSAAWTNNQSGNVSLALGADDLVGVASYKLAETQADLATATAHSVNPAETSFSRTNVSFTLTGSEAESKAVWLQVCDAQNNCTNTSDDIGWDKTAPAITNLGPTPASPNGTNNWYTTNVVNKFKASDTLSGLNNACVTKFPLASGNNVQSQTTSGEGSVKVTSDSCTDVAGNTADGIESATFKVDLYKPTVNITNAPAEGATVNICSSAALPSPSFMASDTQLGSQVDTSKNSGSFTTQPAAGGTGAGDYTYKAQATDFASWTNSATRSYHVVYDTNYSDTSGAYSGVLQPINLTGSRSSFKLGSTVPVKFTLSCNGTPITKAVAKLYLSNVDNSGDPVNEAVATNTPDSGNTFRLTDATTGQYNFNLSTKAGYSFPAPGGGTVTLKEGTWFLWIQLDDGAKFQAASFDVKK